MKILIPGSIAALILSSVSAYADQVFNDDLIVNGSNCVGQDCNNGESFGFDTLRLKENNLRIKFEDTSSSASFPTNDWQITANDSSNGGANKFSIDDIDGGRTPFTIEAGAPSHSLYVDSTGRIGLGKSNPVVEVHVADGDSPTLRLEQDGSSGFTAQTWDLAGNEANFFVRDVTNGSKLPFKIKPGAPTDSLTIAANGNIGIGTVSPTSKLHIKKSNDPQILFDENGDADNSWLIGVNDAYDNSFSMVNSSNAQQGFIFNPNGQFIIHSGGAKINDSFALEINPNGNIIFGGDVEVKGNFTNTSSRSRKENIQQVDYSSILKKIEQLDIASWSYITDVKKSVHIGPMAEDFYKTFQVGVNNRTISPIDTAGVSLAAIKELNKILSQQKSEINHLKQLVAQLANK